MLLQSLYFSRFLPNRPRPLSSFDTHARWQPVTQSARSRWSYGKIEDREQSIIYPWPSTFYPRPSTVDILPSTLDKNLHSKSTYFLKLTHQERVMKVQCLLNRTHSRPQSPSFLGHVVLKRGALEAAVTGGPKISDIRSRTCRSYKIQCSCS